MRCAAGELSSRGHAHHAMMLAISAAARRKIRVAVRRQRHQRLKIRQAQQSEQRDGEEFLQAAIRSYPPDSMRDLLSS